MPRRPSSAYSSTDWHAAPGTTDAALSYLDTAATAHVRTSIRSACNLFLPVHHRGHVAFHQSPTATKTLFNGRVQVVQNVENIFVIKHTVFSTYTCWLLDARTTKTSCFLYVYTHLTYSSLTLLNFRIKQFYVLSACSFCCWTVTYVFVIVIHIFLLSSLLIW